jgi:hypothetical protein
MKKVIALLLAFVVAAGAFAIDLGNGLTIAGEVKTGLKIGTQDDGDDDTDDTRIEPFNNDYGGLIRVRTTFQYENEAGGAKIRLQARNYTGDENKDVPTGYFTAKYAYGWFNLLDSQIRLSAGAIGDDVWGQGQIQNVFDPSYDAVSGVRAQFKFVEGLDFGLALPVTQFTDPTDSTKMEWPLLGEFVGSAIIGGLYTSDAFKVAATVKLNPNIDAEARGAPDGTNKFLKGYVEAIAGVQYTAGDLVASLNAKFDGRKITKADATEGQAAAANGYIRLGPRVNYTVGDILLHGFADIWLPTDSDFEAADSPKTEKSADPDASSTAIAFRIGAEYKLSDTAKIYGQFGSENVGYTDYHGFYLKPGVVFTLGPGSIEIFDKITKIGADEDIGGKIANQFQIDFNLSF